jgi:hypothetical protein
MYEKNFNQLLDMAKKDISFFNYSLELIGEGMQST